MTHRGWHQIAFSRDLRSELSVLKLGSRSVLLHKGKKLRAFDDRCPHRGASLGRGGRIEGDAVICPFHSHRIGLGQKGQGHFGCVDEYPVIEAGGLVFVSLFAEPLDGGFANFMARLATSHAIVPGFSAVFKARPELVIENAFDAQHFCPVHGVLEPPSMRSVSSDAGFVAEAEFLLPPSLWQSGADTGEPIRAPFRAEAFGPTIVVSTLGGSRPYSVITATCRREQATMVFLSLAFANAARPSEEEVNYLLRQMRAGLDADQLIWEHLDETIFNPAPADSTIMALRAYMQKFASE